jgi:hypothetical protein
VDVGTTGLGSILVNAQGQTLYLFGADTRDDECVHRRLCDGVAAPRGVVRPVSRRGPDHGVRQWRQRRRELQWLRARRCESHGTRAAAMRSCSGPTRWVVSCSPARRRCRGAGRRPHGARSRHRAKATVRVRKSCN